MTKLKEETTRLTTAIKEIENELTKYNKGEIQQDINLKSKMNNLLENLMENPEIQKRYPKYFKLKKLFYVIPPLSVATLTLLAILVSLLLGNPEVTFLAPFVIAMADFVLYRALTPICDKKLNENEEYKQYYDIYGDKEYSAKRALKDVRTNEKEIEKDKELLGEIADKETTLLRLNTLLNRLNGIKDDYVERTLGEEYSTEITDVSTQSEEMGLNKPKEPRQKIKK